MQGSNSALFIVLLDSFNLRLHGGEEREFTISYKPKPEGDVESEFTVGVNSAFILLKPYLIFKSL